MMRLKRKKTKESNRGLQTKRNFTCTASPPWPICWRQKARTAVSCASPRYFVRSVAAALAPA